MRLFALILALSSALLAEPAWSADRWVGSWAAAQQAPEPHNALPDAALEDASLRQIVRLSIGGKRIRVLLSNAFGTAPLRIDAAHVALTVSRGTSQIDAASDRVLTFDGKRSVIIPAGTAYWSDPLPFAAAPGTALAVSLYLPAAPKGQTSHPGSRATSFLVHGNRVGSAAFEGATTTEHWFQLAAVAVEATPSARAVVTLGDSITDGHGATTNGDDRWPDQFARRLQQAGGPLRAIGVLNLGIGGNRLLLDGLGPNALARFDRDVLAQPGVRYLVVLEGINDLGTLTRDAPATPAQHAALVAQMIGAYRQIVARAHATGIRVYGATLLPDAGSAYYHPDAANEADRTAVNAWIRAPGHFDGVIDFDAALRDPALPNRIRKEFDSGDGLHPSPAGYRAMAAAISFDLFR